jgi:hypothetical protein
MGGRLKRHDWAARLYDVITDHSTREFAWGEADCCLFVARAVDAMQDTNLEAQLQSQYTDERSALTMIVIHGGLEQAVTSFLGEPTSLRAVRGDVVLIDGGEGDALGICMGSQVVAMGPAGLRNVPRAEIRKVWAQ